MIYRARPGGMHALLLAADRTGTQAKRFGLPRTRDALVELKCALRAAKPAPDEVGGKIGKARSACIAELDAKGAKLNSMLETAPDDVTVHGCQIRPGAAKMISISFWSINLGGFMALQAITWPAIAVIKKFMAKPLVGMPGVELVIAGWVMTAGIILATMALSLRYRPGKFISRKEACRREHENYLKAKEKILDAFGRLESLLPEANGALAARIK
jgi:hypothetical protein